MQLWCFFLSLAMLAAFIVISLVERHSKASSEMLLWKLRIAKFACLVLAGGALLFGWKFAGDISFKGVAESLYSAVKLFFADGTMYETTEPPLPDSSVMSTAYFALYYIVCGVAVYCTAAAVISIFKNFAALSELNRRGRRRNLCVFSELNEKTLVIAKSILDNAKNGTKVEGEGFFSHPPHDDKERKPSFVFCEVFEQNAELYYELTEGARKLGALCIKNDITEVHERLRHAKCYKGSEKRITRYFLAGEDQAENLRQAIAIADAERGADDNRKRIKNLAIFVFATGEANGEVLSSLNENGDNKATYFVRRINPAIMLAYDILADKENYLVDDKEPDRDLHVLVAGMGQYGVELVKMLCWFYQRRTGGITVHIVDRERGIEDRIRAMCPELTDYTAPQNAEDDMRCSLVFHEGVDLFSGTFGALLEDTLSDIDAVYITLGDDDVNAEAAIHLRRLLDRAHYADITEKNGRYMTWGDDQTTDLVRIFAVVHSDKRCQNFSNRSLHNICFVGNDSAIYTYRNIYDHQKEVNAINAHQEKKSIKIFEAAVNSYNASEYDRLSSLARTYHDDFYRHLYGDDLSSKAALEMRRRTENKRWNAYMRTCGYVCKNRALTAEQREAWFVAQYKGPERQWARGKWHNSIVPYSQLGPNEQANNYADLTVKK